jgi:hypothetical protein
MTKQDEIELIVGAVKEAVQEHVNGKIEGLHKKLDCHITKMEPVIDALGFVQVLHKFIKWIGLPFTVVFVGLWVMFKRIIN